jgi:hypothetical protein
MLFPQVIRFHFAKRFNFRAAHPSLAGTQRARLCAQSVAMVTMHYHPIRTTSVRANIWDLRPLVSVELRKGQHEKAWASPNTLARVLARVLHTEAARMARSPLLACVLHEEKTRTARCPSAHRKTAKTKITPRTTHRAVAKISDTATSISKSESRRAVDESCSLDRCKRS